MVKFVFYASKLKKQPFFAHNFKIQGGLGPLPPLSTPMCGARCTKIERATFTIMKFKRAIEAKTFANFLGPCKNR